MYEYQAVLAGIHDGDTLRMDIDLGFSVHFLTPNPRKDLPQSLRIFGYDAPELGRADQLGEQARNALIAWFAAHGGPYTLTTIKDHIDKFGRYLAASIVATDGREAVADAVTAGWLKPYTGQGPKPVWP